MPPITVVAYEPDGEGGWLIQWHDEENLDGLPLYAFFHLTSESVEELRKVRQAVGAPTDKYEQARNRVQNKDNSNAPTGLPRVIQEWLDGYNEHVQDCIDRVNLNVHGAAPQSVLNNARLGVKPEKRWRREDVDQPLENFIESHPIEVDDDDEE